MQKDVGTRLAVRLARAVELQRQSLVVLELLGGLLSSL